MSFLGSILIHLGVLPITDLIGPDVGSVEKLRPVVRGPNIAPAQVMVVKAQPKSEPKPEQPVVVPDEPEPDPVPKAAEVLKPEPKPKPKKRPRRVRKAATRRVSKEPAPPEGHAQRLGVKTDKPDEAEGLAGDLANAGSGAVSDSAPSAPGGGDPDGFEDGTDSPEPIDLDKLLRSYIIKVARLLRRNTTYPRAALRAGLEGRCVVSVTIDGGGRVVSVVLKDSSGHSILDKAAVAAVSQVKRVSPPPQVLAWNMRSVQVPFTFDLLD